MAYTLSSNLRLRLDSNLTASARYNLERLDTLGATFLVDSTSTLRLRSITDILLEPESADLGGSGTGGTLSMGTTSHSLAQINLYTDVLNVTSPLGLRDQGTSGTKYLRLRYNSTLSGSVDTAADRVLTYDLQGADRSIILEGNYTQLGGNLSLTLAGATSLTLPLTGTVATLAGTETLTNKTIHAPDNTLTGIANDSVAADAGIAYSKLDLTDSIVDADVASGAGIVYSKLDLTGQLTNGDISASAAIGRGKIAAGTVGHVVINGNDGYLSSEAHLSKSRGGAGADMSLVTFPASGTLLVSGELTDADIAADADIAGTKIDPDFGGQAIRTSGGLYLSNGVVSNLFRTSNGQADAISYYLPEVAPEQDQVLSSDALGNLSWMTLPGTGTVTSVALALPTALFDISGSPVTGAGTLTATLDNQVAGTVFSGPASGADAAPTFRVLVVDDLPGSIPYTKLALTGTLLDADIAAGAAIAYSKLAALTASRALVSDGSGVVTASAVTDTELGYLDGVTSSIQDQLDALRSTEAYDWEPADGATIAITHTLATKDLTVEVYDIDTGTTLMVDSVVRTSTSVVTLTSSVVPSGSGFRVILRR